MDIRRWQGGKRNTSKTLSGRSEEGKTRQKYPRVRRKFDLFLSDILSVVFGGPILWEVPSAGLLDPKNPLAALFSNYSPPPLAIALLYQRGTWLF